MVLDRRFSVAPMMACTDRHARYLLRLISSRALLYTEMVTTGALVYGKRFESLVYNDAEHPIALQLGGNDPGHMSECARMGEDAGFDEIYLNVGCPSERVKSACFGAALMAEPATVARCVEAMRRAVKTPVTVKTRIGIDALDSYENLHSFIHTVASAGCDVFIIHARKAWLTGLSPRQNRHIPPLRYDVVGQLAQDFPGLSFVLNGGIKTVEDCLLHLEMFDGVMLGREPYANPFMLADIDARIFNVDSKLTTRANVFSRYVDYIEAELAKGIELRHMIRHATGLFQGEPGARSWRRYLSDRQSEPGAGVEVLHDAFQSMLTVAETARERSQLFAAA